MSTPFIKSDFKFSQESLDWIKNTFDCVQNINEWHDLFRTEVSERKLGRKISFEGSPVLEEIKNYLKKFGIDESHYNDINGPDVFISNKPHPTPHFPHFDTATKIRGPQYWGGVKLVKSRFNVCIIYDPNDDMWWWEDVVPGHPLVMQDRRQAVGLKGLSAQERVAHLGEPTSKADMLYGDTCSAFVRTDCAHSFTIKKPGVRLVVTVALDKSIDELTSAMNWAKELNCFVTIKGNGMEVVGKFGVDAVKDGKCPDGVV